MITMTHETIAQGLFDATNWHKSSYSQAANGCVEVGSTRNVIGVRDSKLGPNGPVLSFTPHAWLRFIADLT
jgi:Domain of unknown function (DUF397)